MDIQTLGKLDLLLVFQLLGFVTAVVTDPYIRKRNRTILLLIALLTFSLLVQNNLEYQIASGDGTRLARTGCAIYGYSVRPVIIVLLLKMLKPEKKRWKGWMLCGINAAVYMSAFFTDAAFYIAEEGGYSRGPLGFTCHFVSGLLLVILIAESLKKYSRGRHAEAVIPGLSGLLIVAATVGDLMQKENGPVSYLTMAVVSSCMFYYLWLRLQFARDHEQAVAAEQKIQIMISQMQPHFLFNTLSTIQALCLVDPQVAFETTEKFGTYLRQNIDSLNQTSLIGVEKELEHTRIYTDIEKLRFPSVSVEYNIQDRNFSLPALTIQPLVENAIRHGVRGTPFGQVSVETQHQENSHVIVIRDNGVGFRPGTVDESERSHIGIRNVRDRIELMCGGTMVIDSRLGEGTTVTIRIPQEREDI